MPGIEQPLDAFADGQLAALPMAGDGALVARGAALAQGRRLELQLGDKLGHRGRVSVCLGRRRIKVAGEDCHRSKVY